jgi:uncharacterized protein with NAD-binding domain and iron-sulfur cluster
MAGLPRIAILGGGAGGITAALQLSKGGWRQHYESITVYQQGWRLGGKGACGRGPDLRIEEHGLHIWFGFYENAFRLLDRCHRELDARAEGSAGQPRWELPFLSVDESFRPLVEVGLADHDGCAWKLWVADFFDDDDDRPWYDPDPRPPSERPDEWTVVYFVVRCLRLAADLAWSLVRSDPALGAIAEPAEEAREGAADLDEALGALVAAFGGDLQGLLGAAADLLDALPDDALDQPLVLDALGVLVRALDLVVDLVRRRHDDLLRARDSIRRAYYVVDLMIAIVRGAIEDGVLETDSFSVVDDVDLREWLLAHGATRDTVDCALIRGIVYDLGFAYEGGDPQRPSCAAGTALRGLLRAFFTYRGSLMWKMNAGMGDVVFLPFYELLHKRGVDIRFFHRVEEVRSANGAIEEIEIDVQAEVPQGTSPKSFVTPTPLPGAAGPGAAPPSLAWPSDPSRILGPAAASAAGAPVPAEAYESWYRDRADAYVRTTTLRLGASDGFDLVVFGLPISCVPNVASNLVAKSPRWRRAVDHLRTVPTQALQLWLDRPATELADVEPGTVVSGFVEPFDTWADMSQLRDQERVQGAATVAYFCSVLPDTPPPPRGQAKPWLDERNALVRDQAKRFLTYDIAPLWPGAVDPITGEFRWERLVAPQGNGGIDSLDAQYLRANVEPSERYVLSVPGSSEHRIPPDDAGFANLFAVGDWTACGINAGYVEGAVISGMLAANAIHRTYGDPSHVEPIIGLDGP